MIGEVVGVVGLVSSVLLFILVRRLWKSEERFRLIADNASDLVMLHTAEGTNTWVSPSVERILGYTPKEMVGRNAYELFHPEDVERIRAGSHSPARSGGQDTRITYRIKRKDGTYIWLETLTTPVLGPKGEVKQLQTSSRDVSDRKAAENLYRFLIRNLPDTSVLLFDHKYRHLVAEGTLISGTLRPQGGLEHKTLWDVFPEDIAVTLAPLYRRVFEGQASRLTQSFRTRTYEAHFLPVRDAGEVVRTGMAVFIDVTDKLKRIRQLEERTHDLERSNRDLEQFANVASHELKAPLRRITSFVDLLVEDYGPGLPPEAHEYLGHVEGGVADFQDVVDSLLTYSRVQANQKNTEVVDVNEVFDHAIQAITSLMRDKKATITKSELPSALVADRVLLRQLFENLVGNAIKFNTVSDKPQVWVSASRGLLDWEFEIRDNGPGLDPMYESKVFAMFQRLRPDVEGTGIGLALCKKIVALHRGRIWYERGPGGVGTVFHFTLPARSGTAVP